jgi:hypothetical protein
MDLRDRPQGLAADEPVDGDVPILLRQCFDSQPQVIQLVKLRGQISRFGQGYLVDRGLSRRFLYPLQHAVQYGAGEVGFRIWQARLVIRSCGLAQGEESLTLQVIRQCRTLPMLPVLDEILRQHLHQRYVISDQPLSVLR